MREIVEQYERALREYAPRLGRFKPPKRLYFSSLPRNSYVLGRLIMIGYYDPREDMALKFMDTDNDDLWLVSNRAGNALFVGVRLGEKDLSSRDLVDEWRKFHWGNEPSEVLDLGRVSMKGAQYMGPIATITYETRKGGGAITNYTHAFRWPLPHLIMRDRFPGIVRGTSRFRVEPAGITG